VLTSAARSEPHTYTEEIPEELASICNRATAREPELRFASAAELRDAVTAFLRHRNSIEMAQEAEGTLAQLEKRASTSDEAQVEIRRLFTECRFAFMRALKDWTGNRRAREGLQGALAVMTRIELDRGQLDAAEALLDEMPEADVELREALVEARAEGAKRQKALEALRELERERDLRVGKAPRATFTIILGLMVVVTATLMSREEPIFPNSPLGGIYAMVPFIVVYLAAMSLFRKRLLATLINRQIMLMVGLGIAAMTINRAFAHWAGAEVPYMLSLDLLLAGAVAAVGAIAIDIKLIIPSLIWLVGGAGILAFPDHVFLAYAPSQIGGLIIAGALWYRQRTAR
jgi:serine/threonine-protein kinase